MHKLAVVSKQAGGITFTDQNGNIIMDHDDEEEKDMIEDKPPAANNDNEYINFNREENNH